MNNILKKVELKKFSSVFLTLSLLMQVGILIPLEVGAVTPTTIFEDGFESVGGGFTNWTSGNPENGRWTADNSAKVGGNRSARVKGANDINKTLYKEISTAGYENVSVSYWYKIDGDLEKTGTNTDHFYVEWWDGTNWNELMHLIGPDEGGWIQNNHNLGVGANNNANFKLRFRIKLTATTENIYIDDVKITGIRMPEPEPETAKIIAQKIVCESEEYLPNWGNGGANITSTTAQEYVNQSEGKCSLAEWDFEWAPANTTNPGDNLGVVGGAWNKFSGSVDVSPTSRIWLREVMKEGYVPFSGWLKSGDNTPTEEDKMSAEFYCNNDVLNYDNYEWIDNLVAGQTYYCVGFNAPVEEPLQCDPNVNLIKNGGFETPAVNTAEKWNTFASGFIGLEWLVKWLNPSQDAPETANLELHRGVNGWLSSEGEQYAELDTDYGAPPSNPGGSASVAIWQDIPTIPGKTYKLSFDFSPRPSTNASQNVLGVLWGGEMATTTTRAGVSNTSWTTHTLNLTATTSLTSLMFRDEGNSDSLGTFIDNVSLYCQDKPTDPCTYGSQVFYSDTSHSVGEGNSVATHTHSNWISTTSPAIWMWSDAQVQNPTQDEVKVFTKTINVSGVPTSANLSIAADNGYKVVINGNVVASTTNEYNFGSFVNYDVASALVYGENTIEITVHNWALEGGTYETNPAGVIYALYVDTKLCPGDNPHEPEKLQVEVYKYLDGKIAEGEYSFPMNYSWSYFGKNESGQINLNNPYSYTSETLNAPAIFNLEEVTGGNSNVLPIGAQCQNGKFRLVGYRVGSTLTEAEESDLITTHPSLTNLNSNTYIIVENETCPNLSTVTMCKYDESQNPLSGWTLMLLGNKKQSGLQVPSNDSNGVNSVSLQNNKSYVAIASGTWSNQNGANMVDVEYSTVDNWNTWMDGYTGYQTDILELQINETFDPLSNWGPYNQNHTYAQSFIQTLNGPANFRIFDGVGVLQNLSWFGDNSGHLNVDIYEGFAGITGQNGCVVFENVPFGTYEADEIMKEGWNHLSGRGPVVVDTEDKAVTIFNTTKLPEVVCAEDESFEEGQCKKDDDSDDEGSDETIIQTLTGDTNTGSTPPGGRRRDISGLFGGVGQVLGASTDDEGLMCEPYLKEYIKFGARNNPDEVRKLQIFLNQFFELDNPVTGFYGPITFEMVKKFQAHQEAGTLTPWTIAGIPMDGPTGYVYKTTKRWINILKCPEMLAYTPIPQLP